MSMAGPMDARAAPSGPLFAALKRGVELFDRVSKAAVVAAMGGMAALVVTQVICRYAFAASIDWAEEVARLAFVWAMFLAIPHGIRRGVHVGIDILVMKLPARGQDRVFRAMVALGAVLMAVVFYYAFEVTLYTWPELMPTLNLTAAVYYLAVLIAAAHSILHLAVLGWGGPRVWAGEDTQ